MTEESQLDLETFIQTEEDNDPEENKERLIFKRAKKLCIIVKQDQLGGMQDYSPVYIEVYYTTRETREEGSWYLFKQYHEDLGTPWYIDKGDKERMLKLVTAVEDCIMERSEGCAWDPHDTAFTPFHWCKDITVYTLAEDLQLSSITGKAEYDTISYFKLKELKQ
jgi:hypothetical protein